MIIFVKIFLDGNLISCKKIIQLFESRRFYSCDILFRYLHDTGLTCVKKLEYDTFDWCCKRLYDKFWIYLGDTILADDCVIDRHQVCRDIGFVNIWKYTSHKLALKYFTKYCIDGNIVEWLKHIGKVSCYCI